VSIIFKNEKALESKNLRSITLHQINAFQLSPYSLVGS